MPVEIRKLTIKATVRDRQEHRFVANQRVEPNSIKNIDFTNLKREIIETCLEKVEEMIERKNSR